MANPENGVIKYSVTALKGFSKPSPCSVLHKRIRIVTVMCRGDARPQSKTMSGVDL